MELKLFIEIIRIDNVNKFTSALELMCSVVCFHVSPIPGKMKITNGVQSFSSLIDIIYEQPPTF